MAVIPSAKCVYVCDAVQTNPTTGKPCLLNIWHVVRVPAGRPLPYSLPRFDVFAWLRDGRGQVRCRIDIVRAATNELIYQTGNLVLDFDQAASWFARFAIADCVLPATGYYYIELYCEDRFVDDQLTYVR